MKLPYMTLDGTRYGSVEAISAPVKLKVVQTVTFFTCSVTFKPYVAANRVV